MSDLLSKFNGGEMIGLAAVIGGLLVAAISIVVSQWRRVRIAEMEATLKQQMLDKGMSAADIEQVMKSSRKSDNPAGLVLGPDGRPDQGILVAKMVDGGYGAEDIERVVRAFQDQPGGLTRDRGLVVKKMIDQGHEALDIERVIRAFHSDSSWQQQQQQQFSPRI